MHQSYLQQSFDSKKAVSDHVKEIETL